MHCIFKDSKGHQCNTTTCGRQNSSESKKKNYQIDQQSKHILKQQASLVFRLFKKKNYYIVSLAVSLSNIRIILELLAAM